MSQRYKYDNERRRNASKFMVNRLCQKAKFYIFAPLYQSTVIARPRSLAV